METHGIVGSLAAIIAIVSSVWLLYRYRQRVYIGPPAVTVCGIELNARINQKAKAFDVVSGLMSLACFVVAAVFFGGAPTLAKFIACGVACGLGSFMTLIATQGEVPCDSNPIVIQN